MRFTTMLRWFGALLLVGVFSFAPTARAQDEGGDGGIGGSELGAGLYLGNCESLVEGAALFDLGDVELETEIFDNTDENSAEAGTEEDGTDLEGELEEESSGDETDVEGAIGGEGEDDESGSSDTEVVVQGDAELVWVSTESVFAANLVDLVDAPFAVAIRQDATDDATTEEGAEGEVSSDFVACGEFGGAVAGNQIVIPLSAVAEGEQGFSGIAILEAGAEEGAAAAHIYVFRARSEEEMAGGEDTDVEVAEGEGTEESGEFVEATPEA